MKKKVLTCLFAVVFAATPLSVMNNVHAKMATNIETGSTIKQAVTLAERNKMLVEYLKSSNGDVNSATDEFFANNQFNVVGLSENAISNGFTKIDEENIDDNNKITFCAN